MATDYDQRSVRQSKQRSPAPALCFVLLKIDLDRFLVWCEQRHPSGGHPRASQSRIKVVTRDELGRQVLDQIQAALNNDLLSEDEMRALLEIVKPVVERTGHGISGEVEGN